MTVPIDSALILQLLNSAILNIVNLIKVFGVLAFQLSMVIYAAWFVYQVGRLCGDLILKIKL